MSSSNVVSVNLSGVESALNRLSSQVSAVNDKVDNVSGEVKSVQRELERLRSDFLDMMEEQRRAAALEQATTELVSVRQEMDKKFGNYSVVRNTMVGILQATDAALVRKATISTVSEELMISTPDYWLAPVLVALAAWINNNRDLAERAIREAVRRDNEHTSLAMALICRRNHRTATCYEWLARYFSTQNAVRIDSDSMVYIDAYVNGIFGTDEKHLCDDFMVQWMDQVKGSMPDFVDKQVDNWADYFRTYYADEGSKYPALQGVVKEFGYIDKYLGKLDAINQISGQFSTIQKSEVNAQSLEEQVDRRLMDLVNSDDPKERQLRAQEEYLLAVKACEGDVARARRIVNERDTEKKRQTMNIVEQMVRVVKDGSGKTEAYKKKTAVRFLSPYINKGFTKFKGDDATTFPDKITLEINGWTGVSTTGEEAETLHRGYTAFLEQHKNEELAKATSGTDPKKLKIAGLITLVVGIVLLFPVMPLGIVAIIAGGLLMSRGKGIETRRAKDSEDIEKKYAKLQDEGLQEIDLVLGQWKKAKSSAEELSGLLDMESVA